MLETIGQSFQEFLAGKASVGDVVSRIQKDWSDYDSELKSELATDGSDGPDRGRRSRIAGASPAIRRAARRPGRAARARPGAGRAAARRVPLRGPAMLFYAVFAFAPLIYTGWLSFFDWDGITVGTWAGLDNYNQVLTDPAIRAVVRALARC